VDFDLDTLVVPIIVFGLFVVVPCCVAFVMVFA
jgi:hypothetical protein